MSQQPLVSVIVPTYNSAKYLEACLRSVKDQTYKNVELIVVDNHSTDGTLNIAKRYANESLTKGPERSAQRNYGASKAKGAYILIIDSDMKLTKEVIQQCVDVILRNKKYKALIAPEESFGEGFWAQCKKLERSFYVGVDWMEAARFFPAKIYTEFGGYDEGNTGTEDYDLPQRIEAKYGKESVGRIDSFIMHNEQRLSLIKTCKKKLYYAQELDKYKSNPSNIHKYKKQSNPLYRYQLFFSQPGKLIKNPVVGAGMLFMKSSEFTFGSIGYVTSKLRKV